MALSEKDIEKKNIADIGALLRGYEQKSNELALKVGAGKAKPAEMMALNSDIVLIRKVLDKKMSDQKRMAPRGQPKTAAPLKSFDDYMKGK